MAFGIIIIATIAGYLAGFAAWLAGAGVLLSLGVVMMTGGGVVLGLGLFAVLRGMALPKIVTWRRISN